MDRRIPLVEFRDCIWRTPHECLWKNDVAGGGNTGSRLQICGYVRDGQAAPAGEPALPILPVRGKHELRGLDAQVELAARQGKEAGHDQAENKVRRGVGDGDSRCKAEECARMVLRSHLFLLATYRDLQHILDLPAAFGKAKLMTGGNFAAIGESRDPNGSGAGPIGRIHAWFLPKAQPIDFPSHGVDQAFRSS